MKKHPVLSSSEKVKSIPKAFNCKSRNKIPLQLFEIFKFNEAVYYT